MKIFIVGACRRVERSVGQCALGSKPIDSTFALRQGCHIAFLNRLCLLFFCFYGDAYHYFLNHEELLRSVAKSEKLSLRLPAVNVFVQNFMDNDESFLISAFFTFFLV